MIRVKRIYEPIDVDDGYRVLVDRLWPRGVSKEKAKLDQWLKEIGPSNELRAWFGHKPERFEAFSRKYLEELQSNPALQKLKSIINAHKTVTLLYAAHDQAHNQAVVLRDLLSK